MLSTHLWYVSARSNKGRQALMSGSAVIWCCENELVVLILLRYVLYTSKLGSYCLKATLSNIFLPTLAARTYRYISLISTLQLRSIISILVSILRLSIQLEPRNICSDKVGSGVNKSK